ncbi:MAG: VCBS repeat-containing protein, partial [Maribacter sp.]|uniref:FG-GAP repeat domain-containing protein n=1 Tax=Maribacter sp. TaxID=1897614 RepID=UPI003C75DBCF
MRYLKGLVVLLAISIIGCSEKKDAVTEKSAIYFNSISPEKSGLDFSNTLHPKNDLNIIEYLYYYNGGGVAVGDINNDGLDDVYFTANQSPDRLYLNLGGLKFKDITESAGLAIDSTWSSGVTMEDVNNDGFLDIHVSKVGNYKGLKAHNLLYLNKGNETFEEVSEAVGLAFSGFSTQAAFMDYDKDGDMDMYLMNCSIHTPRSYGRVDKRKEKDSLAGDRFYENKLEEGTLSFKNVTEASGIYSSPLGYGLALVTSDMNQDGLLDIYVGNDFHENDYLYINQGDKTFKEVGADWLNHTTRFTMGADIGDLNNDGLQDVFSLDMMPFDHEVFMKSGGEDSDKVDQIKENFGYGKQYARNNFQLNTGQGTFSDIAPMTNTHATDWSWSVLIEDYDNDGMNDLYITNGIYKRPNDLDYINFLSTTNFSDYSQNQANEIERKLIDQMPTLKLSNVIFKNKGDFEFDRLTTEAGLTPSFSNGSAYSDLDLDGDLDVVVNNINDKAFLLENKSNVEGQHNYIAFDLKDSSKST